MWIAAVSEQTRHLEYTSHATDMFITKLAHHEVVRATLDSVYCRVLYREIFTQPDSGVYLLHVVEAEIE